MYSFLNFIHIHFNVTMRYKYLLHNCKYTYNAAFCNFYWHLSTQVHVPTIFITMSNLFAFRSDSLKEHRKHVSTHQQFSCNYPNCSYSCKLSSNLIKHKRVHTNEKPYLCDRCSFRSNFVNSLKAHRRIHTAEKPYQCEHCSYRCNSSSNLKKHCNLRHSKTPNGNYKWSQKPKYQHVKQLLCVHIHIK